MHKPKTYFIVGYYGYGNAGDDILLHHTINRLSTLPQQTSDTNSFRFQILAPSADSLALSNLGKSHSGEPLAGIYSANSFSNIPRFNPISIIRAIITADTVVYGGGSIFQSKTSKKSFWYYASIALLAIIFKKPLLLLGQGFGPTKYKKMLGWICKNSTYVECRDKQSFEWAKQVNPGAVLRHDMMFDGLSMIRGAREKKAQLAKKNTRPLGEKVVAHEEKTNRKLSIGISMKAPIDPKMWEVVSKHSLDITVITAHEGQDVGEENSQEHSEQNMSCSGNILYITLRDWHALHKFPSIDMVITTRYHTGVMAAMAGLPFIGVSDDPKIEQLCKQFGQPFVNVSQASEFEKTVSMFITNIESFREKIEANIQKVERAVEQGKHRSLGKTLNSAKLKQVLGYTFVTGKKVSILDYLLQESKRMFVHVLTINAEIFIQIDSAEEQFKKTLQNRCICVADGVGIEKGVKWLTRENLTRLPGVDLSTALMEQPLNIACIGASEGVIRDIQDMFSADETKARLVFAHHGYFNNDQEAELISAIASKAPDIVLVAMGHPRQDEFILKLSKYMNRGLAIGVGGTFDVLAGKVERAPKWVQTAGFEWAYRLMTQPARWKRAPLLVQFVIHLLKRRLKN